MICACHSFEDWPFLQVNIRTHFSHSLLKTVSDTLIPEYSKHFTLFLLNACRDILQGRTQLQSEQLILVSTLHIILYNYYNYTPWTNLSLGLQITLGFKFPIVQLVLKKSIQLEQSPRFGNRIPPLSVDGSRVKFYSYISVLVCFVVPHVRFFKRFLFSLCILVYAFFVAGCHTHTNQWL